MQDQINLDQLKSFNPELHAKLVKMIVAKGADPAQVGHLLVDSDAGYHDEAMKELQKYVVERKRIREELRVQQEQEAQRVANENAAYAYYYKLVNTGEIRLADVAENQQKIVAYMVERNQLPSAETVRLAIIALNDSLEWVRMTPSVGKLPSGEPQLPLNASEYEMRHASKEQLQDLSARKGEGRSRSTGSFGSKF